MHVVGFTVLCTRNTQLEEFSYTQYICRFVSIMLFASLSTQKSQFKANNVCNRPMGISITVFYLLFAYASTYLKTLAHTHKQTHIKLSKVFLIQQITHVPVKIPRGHEFFRFSSRYIFHSSNWYALIYQYVRSLPICLVSLTLFGLVLFGKLLQTLMTTVTIAIYSEMSILIWDNSSELDFNFKFSFQMLKTKNIYMYYCM